MKKNPYLKTELKYFLHTFNRQPLLIAKANGSTVWDEKGRRYLDFYSGLAVCGVGHNHRRVVEALKKQAGRLIHSSNFFYTRPQLRLAEALTKKWKGSKVFFSNSGAEANELAIKLARLWASHHRKPGRDIVTFTNGFHGRTLATTAASAWGRDSRIPFGPLPAGFRRAEFNNLERVKKAVNKNSIGVMIEPVQGEGGIRIADRNFLKGLSNLCRSNNLLLIIDEIQSGMGRSGTFFAFEQYGVQPDIVTLAKGLAGGFPLGATLAKTSVAKWMEPGLHGSTFGGNPVSCAASLEVIKLLSPRSLQSIRATGIYLKNKLKEFEIYPSVASVRGLGLLLAIELRCEGAAYVSLAREKGLLINCTQGNVLRFLPPYFMSRRELGDALAILHTVFQALG